MIEKTKDLTLLEQSVVLLKSRSFTFHTLLPSLLFCRLWCINLAGLTDSLGVPTQDPIVEIVLAVVLVNDASELTLLVHHSPVRIQPLPEPNGFRLDDYVARVGKQDATFFMRCLPQFFEELLNVHSNN